MKKNFLKYFLIAIPVLSVVFVAFLIVFYLVVPNKIFQSQKFANFVSREVNKFSGIELEIKNPVLKTYLKPDIDFGIKKLYLTKNKVILVDLEDFEASINFKNIFKKEIKLNYLLSKNLVINTDKLLKALDIKEQQNVSGEFDWKFDLYNSKIKLDNLFVSYKQDNNTSVEINTNNITLNCKNEYKLLNFDFVAKILNKKEEFVKVTTSARDEIKIYNDKIKIENLNILIDNSKVTIASDIDKNTCFINAKSRKFYLKDVFDLISSDFIIPNGSEMLKPLSNPSGSISFDINSLNGNLSGNITIDNTKANIKDITSIPVNIQKGKIQITKDKISFVDLNGYCGKNRKNEIKIKGDIKDYYKTFDSNIFVEAVISNEFLKDYLSPLISNTVLELSKPIKTLVVYKAKNNIMDITWLAKVPCGVEFGLKGSTTSALTNFERAIKGDFNITGDTIDIKNINYYIAKDIKKGVKLAPILVISGKMKLSGMIDNIGFSFGREMPCEFLNIFTKKRTFKKGTIKGNLFVQFKDNIPVLKADMQINKTLLPEQRLFIKSAKLLTDNNIIKVELDGGFKKIRFDFDGKIKNQLTAPYIIKDMSLNLDNINVERLLASLNNQNDTKLVSAENINSQDDIKDDDYFFDTNLIRIENSAFNLKKGNYKELTFSDICASMTLDKNGILNIQSNKFNIAEGISTLKLRSDLKNLTHYVRLGVKDVDSNLMAKIILNLDKEISGKAKGLIELNTDKTMKLNGKIRFAMDDGAIGKIGLVEYVLKIASIFRNPIVMISPSAIMDIINIPEGRFDKITGSIDLKDNVAHKIDIRSSSPTLSALIRGRFDMEKHDASIRIYTRFSTEKKSVFSFLRNMSLNTIANKVQMNTNNDLNYYSSELADLPQIEIGEQKSQIFLTQVEGDVEHNNYLSSLKKLK